MIKKLVVENRRQSDYVNLYWYMVTNIKPKTPGMVASKIELIF